MASSNRHWPSMFKSKPCSATHPHHQWQHDIFSQNPPSLSSGLGAAGEERSPEPKPRWNPRPEQIRILETIFNSGMVNPPRDEIRKIRVQLQEYGQVGDANVFYWFQNRKSRSKHKQRLGHPQSAAPARGHHHQRAAAANSSAATASPPPLAIAPVPLAAAKSSSSSSSELSTGCCDRVLPLVSVGFTSVMEAPPAAASPTASSNQGYFQTPTTEFFVEPVYLRGSSQGFCLSTVGELSGVVAVQDPAAIGLMPGLWTELMMGQQQDGVKSSTGGGADVSNKSTTTAKIQNPNPSVVAAVSTTTAAAAAFGGPVNEIQGIGGGVGGGAARSTVFINGVGFDVVVGPFNVREVFGEEAVLIHASGHPVLTDEWGITLHPLHHGASYFLM